MQPNSEPQHRRPTARSMRALRPDPLRPAQDGGDGCSGTESGPGPADEQRRDPSRAPGRARCIAHGSRGASEPATRAAGAPPDRHHSPSRRGHHPPVPGDRAAGCSRSAAWSTASLRNATWAGRVEGLPATVHHRTAAIPSAGVPGSHWAGTFITTAATPHQRRRSAAVARTASSTFLEGALPSDSESKRIVSPVEATTPASRTGQTPAGTSAIQRTMWSSWAG